MRINKSLITYIPTSGSGSGTVTSVALSATMPTGLTASISGSPITSSGTLGLTLTFTAGYSIPTTAKQTEWDSAYANRIISLTTTGSSGAATLITNVLNIPNYTLAGLGGVPTTRTITINGTSFDLSANRTYNVGTVTSVAALTIGTTGTDITSSVANGTTTPVITLNIPTASATNRGALSSTDWLTFSSKQPAITLTTTGNNGSSTLIGATLNVPTYTLVGLGGMSNPFTTGIGQMIYSNGAGAPLSLAPNTTTTKKYLSMTGDGTNGDAPFWDTISGITGTGTIGYLSKFTSSTALGNSLLSEAATVVTLGQGGSASVYAFEIGEGRSGNGFALIDFIGDTTHTDYGMRLIRGNSGANTESQIEHRGTGALILKANDAGVIINNVNGANRTYLDSVGNYLIGSGIPYARLHVKGGAFATNDTGFMVAATLTNGRLETYDSGSCQAIHTFFDNQTYELSAGSTAGYVSGLVVTGRGAVLNPDRVAIYTRSVQRLQVGGTGQLQLNAYTSVSSFTGTPTAYLACDSSGNIITSNPSTGRNTRLAFSAEVPNTWANMPTTLQFFDSSSAYVTQIDLSYYNQVRLIVNKQGTAGATGSKLLVRYQATTGSPFTESSYLDIGTSEVSVLVDTTSTILTTSWINLASGAIGDVWVALMGIDGDTVADPVFGNIYAEFRFN